MTGSASWWTAMRLQRSLLPAPGKQRVGSWALLCMCPKGRNDAVAQARISYEWVEAEGPVPAWVAAVDWQLGADSICIEDIDEAFEQGMRAGTTDSWCGGGAW